MNSLMFLVIIESITITSLFIQILYLLAIWQKLKHRLALLYAMFSASLLVWGLSFVVEKVFMHSIVGDIAVRVEIIGWALVCAMFGVFILHFTRHRFSKYLWIQLLMFLPGVLAGLSLITGFPHGAIYFVSSETWGYTDVTGPVMYVYVAYVAILVSVLSIMLLKAAFLTRNRSYRLQLISMLFLMSAPLLIRLLFMIFKIAPFDPTTMSFSVPALMFFYELYFLRIFSTQAVARDSIFENQNISIIAFDMDLHIIDINNYMKQFLMGMGVAAGTSFEMDRFEIAMKGRSRDTKDVRRIMNFLRKRKDGNLKVEIEMSDRMDTILDINVLALSNQDGTHLGHAMIIEDVTEKRALQRSVNEYNRKLKKANRKLSRLNEKLLESQRELKVTNTSLEAAVYDRTMELRDKYVELRDMHHDLTRAMRFSNLGEIAGQSAHEVLNPITTISGKIHMLNSEMLDEIVSSISILNVISSAWRKDYNEGGMERLMENENRVREENGKRSIELDLDSLDEVYTVIHETVNRSMGELDYMVREIDRVVMIVDRLRFLARTKVTICSQPIAPILDETEDILHSSLKKRNIVYEHFEDDGLQVTVDRGEFLQVMINLVRNSFQAIEQKFQCESGGTIEIRCTLLGDEVEVLVIDNGMGIELEDQKNIFDLDFTTKDESEGTGLGLGFSRDLLDGFGAMLELRESTPGVGTTFCIHLPLEPETDGSEEDWREQVRTPDEFPGMIS